MKILRAKAELQLRQLWKIGLIIACHGTPCALSAERVSFECDSAKQNQGRYLATIGVCAACHTPPNVTQSPPTQPELIKRERHFRNDPDWFRYLGPDADNAFTGGVPFILRFGPDSSGVVFSRNITPDTATGIGSWTDDEVIQVLRTGQRKDGSSLFLFPPHTFFGNLAEDDLSALVCYLRSLEPKTSTIPNRQLPFVPEAAPVKPLKLHAPTGRSMERAQYLMDAIVGCKECHSHSAGGKLREFVGGDIGDPFLGVFRLGPDLPLRSGERGLATFPFPGFAILYAPNLTRFGLAGDLNHIANDRIVDAIRKGVSVLSDPYGRPDPLGHIMMWQFYSVMSDEDAFSIAEYLKTLSYVPHMPPEDHQYFGTDWEGAFKQVFGATPSHADRVLFGKGP